MLNETYNQKADTGDPSQGARTALASPLPPLTISLMTKADIPAFLALQSIVRNSLPEGHKHHLKERTAEDLDAHLNAGMPLIGVKSQDGLLVAQALISFPDNPAAKNLEGYPIHGIEGLAAVIQSVAIHPDFRGKELGLAAFIHQNILKTALQNERSILMAKVADTNPASQRSFMNNSFELASKGTDPTKGYGVAYFRKDLAPEEPIYGAASRAIALNAKVA